jgi:short-subunit dehydrogenase
MSAIHVIVTGASSGIGEAVAREYLKRGALLTLVARRRAKLEELASGNEHRCHVVEADLSDTAHACDWVDGAVAALGPVDVLVNNAGAQIVGPAAATPWEDAERLLRLNELSPLRLAMCVLPAMLKRRHGTIVDISSVAALAPPPGMLFYNASKAALAAASETLREELRGTGVHVMTVYPGSVRTALSAATRAAYQDTPRARVVFGPLGEADVLARMIADGVADVRPRIIYPRGYELVRRFRNVASFLAQRLAPPLKQTPAGAER